MDVLGPGRQRQRQPLNIVFELYERLFYTPCRGHADRVSRRALQERPQPGQGHGLQVVPEPVHGLRAPLHVLLRPSLRKAIGPAVGRPLRDVDPSEDERRRRVAEGARARDLAVRAGDRRRCDRPVPAGRREVQAHARVPRGVPRRRESVRDHHARADDRARSRRARRGIAAGGRERDVLDPDARRGGLEAHRAVDRASTSAAEGREGARRSRREGERRHGADPARDLRPARATAGGGARGPRGGRDRNLGQPPLPAPRDTGALPRASRGGLARAAAALRASLRPPACLPRRRGAKSAP